MVGSAPAIKVLIEAVVIVLAVSFLSLGFRTCIVVARSIPLVLVIFWFKFGLGLVLATIVMVVTYILFTQRVTDWRNKLRESFEILAQFERPINPDHAKKWERANTNFHEALLSACGSPWTMRVIRQLTQHGERYRRYAIGLQSGRDVHSEHELIFQSAIEGQDARAALALESHIRATPELIISTIQGGVDVFKQG